MTAIFLFHQSIHFWGASTAQPGFEIPGNLKFGNLQEVSEQKRQGNLNNIRICNGNVSQEPANASGVLVECLPNNGNYNISVEIPKPKSGPDTTDQNGGLATLVEEWSGRDPNVKITPGEDNDLINIPGVNSNTRISFFP